MWFHSHNDDQKVICRCQMNDLFAKSVFLITFFSILLFFQVKSEYVYKVWRSESEEQSSISGFLQKKLLKHPLILLFLLLKTHILSLFPASAATSCVIFSNSNVGLTGPPSKVLGRAWVLSSERAQSAWQWSLETLRMCLQLEAAEKSGK